MSLKLNPRTIEAVALDEDWRALNVRLAEQALIETKTPDTLQDVANWRKAQATQRLAGPPSSVAHCDCPPPHDQGCTL